MIELIAETAQGKKQMIRARQYGEAFARAEELGAVFETNGLGARFMCISGLWIGFPNEGDKGDNR